ncbi:transcriptional regulator [Halobium salinum]|uniref:Transcriptional regulator n=1 Tax=Halobium salinum TaxID=1364940 RepID=A0ABD5P9Z1_9EURY|nr:transcriptional regulator [Halobium salinum]
MAELNPIAKRLHNVSPDPVECTLDDGSTAVFHLDWTEFFQLEFRAEGRREGDDGEYRFVTSEDNERVLVARRDGESDDWSVVGSVTEAEAA